ncbi:MAG: RNA polymerase sigma factor [FCB group bacterium]|jgi:RNA polymerase sigma-70 factor (ECF subfamily)
MLSENDKSIEDVLFLKYCETGDAKYFEELYRLVHTWLFRLVYRIVADRDVAADIQQDSWIKLIGMSDSFDHSKGKIRNLLFTIAKNKALNYKISEKRKMIYFDRQKDVNNEDGGNPEQDFILFERSSMLKNLIGRLPEDFQHVVYLYYYADLGIKEIAKLIDRPEGTVKIWLMRSRNKLEKVIRKKYSNVITLNMFIIPLKFTFR